MESRKIIFASIVASVTAIACAPAPPPEPSKISETSRNSGETQCPAGSNSTNCSANQTPSTPVTQTTLLGAKAGDPKTQTLVDQCLRSGSAIARNDNYKCLPKDAPKLNQKFRSYADLENATLFPAATLAQVKAWMDKKGLLPEHFDFAVSCLAGAPDNIICKNSSTGQKIEGGTVLSYAKNETKDGKEVTTISSTIINAIME